MQKEHLNLLKTKTFWSGVGLIGYGVIQLTTGSSEGFQSILEGLAFIFVRSSLMKQSAGGSNGS
jgi:hypothetical protein